MNEIPAWQYDEMKSCGVDYADISEVQAYDERMGKFRNVTAESQAVIAALSLPESAAILEIGTGTGAFAFEAAQYYAQVTAIDTSAVMLEYARHQALKRGAAHLNLINAGFLTYQHQGKPLDAVVSQLALHHLPDFWKLIALKKVHRLLKDGGQFYLRDIVFSFEPDNYQAFFDRWVNGLKQAAGEEIAKDTEVSIKSEYYTYDWIMEGLLTRAGFNIKSKDYMDGFMAVYLCQK